MSSFAEHVRQCCGALLDEVCGDLDASGVVFAVKSGGSRQAMRTAAKVTSVRSSGFANTTQLWRAAGMLQSVPGRRFEDFVSIGWNRILLA
jgi:hypothetical protein